MGGTHVEWLIDWQRTHGSTHPTQQFRRVDRAYKVLTDPLMRQAYDLYGERVSR